jgi:uncharacterized membrane protein
VWHFTLALGSSITFMLLVAAAAIALTVFFYSRSFRHLSRRQWRILVALRIAALVLLLALLFQPVISFKWGTRERRHIIFLVDSSASMSTVDDSSGINRYDQARARVLDWWGKLSEDFDLDLFEFSDRALKLASPADLSQINPTGQATSLSRALVTAGQNVPRRDIEAVVLLSDGINNSAGDPGQAARKLGVVVHTVGVGNSLRGSPSYRDVQITGVECPNEVPVNNRAQVKAFVDAIGYLGRVVKVQIEEDGKVLDEAEVELDDKEGSQEKVLQFTPTTKGRHTYTVRVLPQSDEKIKDNNQRVVSIQVIDVRLRVLYLEGTLRPEYGALVDRFFSKDPDIEFCALVQTRTNIFNQRSNIQGLKVTSIPSEAEVVDKFDVFVIGDLDSSYLKPAQAELLKKRVQEGGGLIMLGGYHSLGPGGYSGSPLAELLPINLGDRDIGQVTDPFLPVLTPDGKQHPIFANIAPFFPTAAGEAQTAGLPPLLGCVKVLGLKPAATALAVHPGALAEGSRPMPVLAVQPCGKGRAAVFTADSTRSWQQALHAQGQKSPFHRFWGQTIRWLANRKEGLESGISVRTDKGSYEPDAPVTISAVLRDKEGEGISQAQVTARVTSPSGAEETVPLALMPGAAGNYEGTLEPRQGGSYEIHVEARCGPNTLKADKLVVEVGRPNLEFERLELDDKLLTRVAGETGGRYQHLTTADRLIEGLDRKERRLEKPVEVPLSWPPGFWVLFVGTLAGEWVLRKKFQLR